MDGALAVAPDHRVERSDGARAARVLREGEEAGVQLLELLLGFTWVDWGVAVEKGGWVRGVWEKGCPLAIRSLRKPSAGRYVCVCMSAYPPQRTLTGPLGSSSIQRICMYCQYSMSPRAFRPGVSSWRTSHSPLAISRAAQWPRVAAKSALHLSVGLRCWGWGWGVGLVDGWVGRSVSIGWGSRD